MKRPRTVRDVVRRGSTASVTSKSSQAGTNVTSAPAASGRSNPRWAWHQGVLLALRDRLLAERQARLTEAAQPLEPHSMSAADSASDEFDHNVALAMLSAEQDALREIEAALQRLRTGTYGVCEETGQTIPSARLKAIPWTRFARAVEAQHEAAGDIKAPHLGTLGSIRSLPTAGRPSDAIAVETSSLTLPPATAIPNPGQPFPSEELNPET